MTRIDELNAALAAANLGEAEVWPDWDADGDTGHYCVGNRECPSLVTCGEGTEATARFVAVAVHLLPQLAEAVPLLQDMVQLAYDATQYDEDDECKAADMERIMKATTFLRGLQ